MSGVGGWSRYATRAAANHSSAVPTGTTVAVASAAVRVRSGTTTAPAAAAARSERRVRPAMTIRPSTPSSVAGAIMSMVLDGKWSSPAAGDSTRETAATTARRAVANQLSLAPR